VNNNYNSNTVVKQDSAVVKQVDGRAGTHDRHNSAPELAEHPPYQIMLDPSLVQMLKMLQSFRYEPNQY
jgi:hypothetical protein